MTAQRTLKAIVFTDIEGYSAVTAKNEQKALAYLEKYRKVINEGTVVHDGSVIHFYGDGSLSVHTSALDAVRAAMHMQQQFSAEPLVPVRIGVHVGEIIEKDDTIYGNAVNISSRIQALGAANTILVSGAVAEQLSNQDEFTCVQLGKQQLKNIKEPVDIYAIRDRGGSLAIPDIQELTKRNPLTRRGPSLKWVITSIVSLLALIIIGVVTRSPQPIPGQEDRLIILPFRNATMDTSLNDIGKVACHFLISGLDDIDQLKIVSSFPAMLELDQSRTMGLDVLSRRSTRASTVLEGTYFLERDTLLFRTAIKKIGTDEIVVRFPEVQAHKSRYMEALEDLLNVVAGYWMSKEQQPLSIPTDDAYKALVTGISYWKSDFAKASFYLEKAIGYDSTYIDAYLRLFDVYYNQNAFAQCDSVWQLIGQRFDEQQFNERQRATLAYYRALSAGDLSSAVLRHRPMYEKDADELYRNTSMALLYLEYGNDPEKCRQVLDRIPLDSLDFGTCAYCLDRIDAAVVSAILLDDTVHVQESLSHYPPSPDFLRHYEVQGLAFAYLTDTARLEQMLSSVRNLAGDVVYRELLFHVALDFERFGPDTFRLLYLQKAYNAHRGYRNNDYADILIRMDSIDQGIAHLKSLRRTYPDNQYIAYQIALGYGKQQVRDSASTYMALVSRLDAGNDRGRTQYMLAEIQAALGNAETAISHLERAIAEGRLFRYNRFALDPDLRPLFSHPDFERIIHPKLE